MTWAKQKQPLALTSFADVDSKGFKANLSQAQPQQSIERCAGCHSRRESLGADSAPVGEPFDDHYRIALLREGLYHADGQILDEVYVYGSFLQSKMYAKGVQCNHCHDPHTAQVIADLDAVCTQCHRPEANTDFPSLRSASYTSPSHHRHSTDSEAARCVSCHMPEQTYMGVDLRRDHSFRIPRPDLSVKLGVPNACNGCHADQSAQWAQSQVEQWFPKGRHLQPHYGEALHAGREQMDEAAVEKLIELALDSNQPAIVRATALELLVPVVSPPIAGRVLHLLKDSSPMIRSAMLSLFQAAPAGARAKYSGPLLDDPIRSVRIDAAKQVLGVSTENLSASDQAIVNAAIEEYQVSLAAQADFPEIQLNLSRFAERLGNRKVATQALRAALALDPKLAEAWFRLAQLDINSGYFEQAKAHLERAIAEVPDSGALFHMLGRVLVQMDDAVAALQAFEQALERMPTDLEVRIEYASLLSTLGKYREAFESLKYVDQDAQTNPQVLYLLAFNRFKLGDEDAGRRYAEELSALHPRHALNKHLKSIFYPH